MYNPKKLEFDEKIMPKKSIYYALVWRVGVIVLLLILSFGVFTLFGKSLGYRDRIKDEQRERKSIETIIHEGNYKGFCWQMNDGKWYFFDGKEAKEIVILP